jgi:hypothetical protein
LTIIRSRIGGYNLTMRITIHSIVLMIACVANLPAIGQAQTVTPIPPELRQRLNLDPFYEKCVMLRQFPIVGSAKVHDQALLEAAFLINQMLNGRDDILDAMAQNKVRLAVMASTEYTTDVPEHSDLTPRDFMNRRARGLGPTPQRPAVSCGEENLLCFPGDPYSTENILIHEFSHAIHDMGLSTVDPTFDGRLKKAYEQAMDEGLWEDKYASENRHEYWAEGVQSWFDCNRENDYEHNHVNTRDELKAYDPRLAALVAEVFGDRPWRYTRPANRPADQTAHLAGFDPSKAPRFSFPARAVKANDDGDGGADAPKEGEPLMSLKLSPPTNVAEVRSGEAVVETRIVFVNQTEGDVRTFWIDEEGEQHEYSRIRRGRTHDQHTFAGHAWLITDAKRQPLGVVVAGEKRGRVKIASVAPIAPDNPEAPTE